VLLELGALPPPLEQQALNANAAVVATAMAIPILLFIECLTTPRTA